MSTNAVMENKSESENESIAFYASHDHEIFRNNFNGYCVFTVTVAGTNRLPVQNLIKNGKVTCVGTVPEFRRGTPLFITGSVTDSEFGKQVSVKEVVERSWDDTGLATYIASICSGIGLGIATLITDAYGNDIFEKVRDLNFPQELTNRVPAVSIEQATILCETIRSTGLQKDVYTHIVKYGGTWLNALKIVQQCGAYSLKELETNPYEIGMAGGMDFYACDKLAKATHITATDDTRIKQALIRAFETEKNRGNSFSLETDICNAARHVIKKSAFNEDVSSTIFLNKLSHDDDFVMEFDDDGNEGVYLRYMLKAEKETAEQLHRLQKSAVELNYDESIVEWAESNCGIKYAPQQKASFDLIRRSGVAVITGGPGTGKTTTVNGLISAYEKLNPNKIIRLCAPTGRAAQRMAESTDREAITIHRLLDYRPFGKDVTFKNASDPIEADLIVIDEASMLDIELASIFLSAVRSGALVLFIGDIDQLPSVGAGDVLHDIIGSQMIPTVQLTTVYRQGEQSPIILNASRINQGLTVFVENDDYKNVKANSPESAGVRAVVLARSMFDKNNPFDTQVLCPTHKGSAGVASINNALQRMLNPPQGQPEMKYGNRLYRVGDKVILLNNNYNAGYFNGDLGIITGINNEGIDIDISSKILHIGKTDMEDVNLAYAMTIHKSQGSEFKNVIVVLPMHPGNMLKRNLLYTAVTRAKKTVTVIAEGDAISVATNTCDTGGRNTRLIERIRKNFGCGDEKKDGKSGADE